MLRTFQIVLKRMICTKKKINDEMKQEENYVPLFSLRSGQDRGVYRLSDKYSNRKFTELPASFSHRVGKFVNMATISGSCH